MLFYLFFEGGLIPMFLIIGVWGGPRRVYASVQVLPLHAARLGADAARHHGDVLDAGTTDIPTLMKHGNFPRDMQTWAVAGVLRVVRGEDADVAGPHLAAGRARRGADRGLGRSWPPSC